MPIYTPDNTLIIVPAWNEEATVGKVVTELRETGYEVLVVNDGSRDGTSDAARAAGARVLDLPFNLGVGGALRAGFKIALREGFNAIIQIDADGQHPRESISELINEANSCGAHLVLGSRFRSEQTTMNVGFVRRSVMRLLAYSASQATGARISDATSGFRFIGGDLLRAFSWNFPMSYLGDTYEALVSAGRAGYTVVEIPAALKDRETGQSSANRLQAFKFTLKALVVVLLHIHQRIPPNKFKEASFRR